MTSDQLADAPLDERPAGGPRTRAFCKECGGDLRDGSAASDVGGGWGGGLGHEECERQAGVLRSRLEAEQDLVDQLRRKAAEERRARLGAERREEVSKAEAADKLGEALRRVRTLGQEAEEARREAGEERRRRADDARRAKPREELEQRIADMQGEIDGLRLALASERDASRRTFEQAAKDREEQTAREAVSAEVIEEWQGRARGAERALEEAQAVAVKREETARQTSDALRKERGMVLSLRERVAGLERECERLRGVGKKYAGVERERERERIAKAEEAIGDAALLRGRVAAMEEDARAHTLEIQRIRGESHAVCTRHLVIVRREDFQTC